MSKHFVLYLLFTLLLIWACNDSPFDYPNESNSIKGKIQVGLWTENNSTQLSFNYPNWSKPITIDFIYCEDECESMSTLDDKTWKSIELNGENTLVADEIAASIAVAAIRDPFGNIRTNKLDIQYAIPYQYLLRTGHQVIQWPDPQTGRSTLLMIGGYDSYSYLNDCWKSEDGINWTLVTNNAVFSPRAYHGLIHMPDPNNGNKETLWIIGGSQDLSDFEVWKSTDGKIWDTVCKDITFIRRRNFQVVTMPDPSNGFKQTMWMIGGQYPGFPPTNSIVKSVDGVNWTFASQPNPFPPRYGHQVVSMPDPSNNYKNTLWIVGGIGNDGNYLDDIWKSVDGINWSRVVPTGSFFGSRFGHQVVVMEEEGRSALWLIGGFSDPFGSWGDVWKSYDGIAWTRTANKILSKVAFHNAVVFKDHFETGNSVIISGGETEDGEVIIEQKKTHDGIRFRSPNVLEFVF